MAWSEADAEACLLGRELFGMRFGLERMHRLTTVLGMPQRRFAQVHVVGSNGKSSTTRFVAALLERHGLATGTYVSPHLRSFRERIEVGERPIAPERFAAAVERAAEAAELVERAAPDGDERVTQFELCTAAAFHELAARRVDVAVIEAGLGGRFDATNVIPSRVTVLTGVGLEHTRWLGPTVADIAAEKLAVLRDHSTLVVPPDLDPAARAVADRAAAERHARLVVADPTPRPASAAIDVDVPANISPERRHRSERAAMGALGAFQRRNFALACAAAEAFLGRALDPAAVASAAAETTVPGRMEVVADAPLTIHDGAHNPAGAAALADALGEVVGERRPLVAVVSVLDDKDAAEMLAPLLGVADRLVATRCANPRALSPGTLATLAAQLGHPDAEIVSEPRAAVERARALAGTGGAVVATGSIYLIADLVRDVGDRRASSL
ncbi:MAG: dihydrofolate synthase [Solirubrobacterales bacterium]|nr:dihydrofolate synthase [Solirubrobacterales bacterium]